MTKTPRRKSNPKARYCQPTPPNPFEPVKSPKFLTGIPVNPATTVKLLVAPEDPETKTLSVLNSPEKDSDPLKIKKLEFAGLRPF